VGLVRFGNRRYSAFPRKLQSTPFVHRNSVDATSGARALERVE
jgi:hypothetical protein